MSFELVIFTAAVVLMLGTVLTKYLTTIRLVRHRDRLREIEAEVSEKRGRLKGVQNEKAVVESNEKTLNAQKDRLEKRIPNLRKELDKLS